MKKKDGSIPPRYILPLLFFPVLLAFGYFILNYNYGDTNAEHYRAHPALCQDSISRFDSLFAKELYLASSFDKERSFDNIDSLFIDSCLSGNIMLYYAVFVDDVSYFMKGFHRFRNNIEKIKDKLECVKPFILICLIALAVLVVIWMFLYFLLLLKYFVCGILYVIHKLFEKCQFCHNRSCSENDDFQRKKPVRHFTVGTENWFGVNVKFFGYKDSTS